MSDEPQFTYEAADELLAEWYPDSLAENDPEWWRDMIEILLELGSRDAAVEWLEHPHAD